MNIISVRKSRLYQRLIKYRFIKENITIPTYLYKVIHPKISGDLVLTLYIGILNPIDARDKSPNRNLEVHEKDFKRRLAWAMGPIHSL